MVDPDAADAVPPRRPRRRLPRSFTEQPDASASQEGGPALQSLCSHQGGVASKAPAATAVNDPSASSAAAGPSAACAAGLPFGEGQAELECPEAAQEVRIVPSSPEQHISKFGLPSAVVEAYMNAGLTQLYPWQAAALARCAEVQSVRSLPSLSPRRRLHALPHGKPAAASSPPQA